MMRILMLAALLALAAGSVLAVPTGHTGQPNQECGSAGATVMPPGFNTAGFAHAETVYAGSGVSANTSNSPHAVAQYDVACFQLTQTGR